MFRSCLSSLLEGKLPEGRDHVWLAHCWIRYTQFSAWHWASRYTECGLLPSVCKTQPPYNYVQCPLVIWLPLQFLGLIPALLASLFAPLKHLQFLSLLDCLLLRTLSPPTGISLHLCLPVKLHLIPQDSSELAPPLGSHQQQFQAECSASPNSHSTIKFL